MIFNSDWLKAQSTIPTTTVSGCLKVDSSVVTTGSVSVGGILTVDSALTVNDDVKTENLDVSGDLSVIGNASFTGQIIANKGIAFDNTGGNIISYTNTGTSNIYSYGKILPVLPTYITPNTGNSNPSHNFFGMMSSRANNGLVNSALNVGSAPWDGNGVIEVEGSDQNGADNNILMINYFCGRNTAINTNNSLPNEGGIVYMGKRVAMQNSLRIGWDGSNPIDVNSNLSIHTANGNAIKFVTWDNSAKIINLNNGNFASPPFTLYGNGVMNFSTNANYNNVKLFAIDNIAFPKSVFEILGNGKTAIGGERVVGTHADALLTVSGKIVSKSLFVLKPTTWSDYVFSTTYKLEDLYSVEKYILEHKHLKGIPSEESVLNDGYDLNEMDAKLLAKIEESMLYIIALQKELEFLKQQLKKEK